MLSPTDVRSVVSLVRELHDPAMTFEQRCGLIARSLCELTGSLRCIVAEVDISRAPWPYELQIYGDHGHLDDSDIRFLHTCMSDSEAIDRIAGVAASERGKTITISARQAFGEGVWSESPLYDRYFRPLKIHDLMHSRSPVKVRDGWAGWIALTRREEDGVFSEREAAIVESIHAELGDWLWGQLAGRHVAPASPANGAGAQETSAHAGVNGFQPTPAQFALMERLSGAERRILPLLLTGRTEAQIAEMIHRSKHTVHDHAKRVYAAVGVSSRIELVLLFARLEREDVPAKNGTTR